MKKIICIVLTCLMFIMLMPQAFALPQDYSVTVNYEVPDTYMLYIPSEVNAGEPISLYAEQVNIVEGKQISVSLGGIDEHGFADVYNDVDPTKVIKVRFQNDGGEYFTQQNNIVAQFNNNSKPTDIVNILTSVEPYNSYDLPAGSYTGGISLIADCQ
jgi:hypothetical protein